MSAGKGVARKSAPTLNKDANTTTTSATRQSTSTVSSNTIKRGEDRKPGGSNSTNTVLLSKLDTGNSKSYLKSNLASKSLELSESIGINNNDNFNNKSKSRNINDKNKNKNIVKNSNSAHLNCNSSCDNNSEIHLYKNSSYCENSIKNKCRSNLSLINSTALEGDVSSALDCTLTNVERTLKSIMPHLSALSEIERRVGELTRTIHEMQIKDGLDDLALKELKLNYSESMTKIALLEVRIDIMQKHVEQSTKDTKNTENCFDFVDSDTGTTNHHTNPILSSYLTNTTNNSHEKVENNVQDGQVAGSLQSITPTTIINSHNENNDTENSHIEISHKNSNLSNKSDQNLHTHTHTKQLS